jgi:hypothetical protein
MPEPKPFRLDDTLTVEHLSGSARATVKIFDFNCNPTSMNPPKAFKVHWQGENLSGTYLLDVETGELYLKKRKLLWKVVPEQTARLPITAQEAQREARSLSILNKPLHERVKGHR